MKPAARTKHLVSIALIAILSHPVLADLPLSTPVPGGFAVIPLYSSDNPIPDVAYGRRKIRVVEHDGFWWAMAGIGLDTIPGDYIILVSVGEEIPQPVSFNVGPHSYPFAAIEDDDVRGVSRLRALLFSGTPTTTSTDDQPIENWQLQVSTTLPLSFPADGEWDDRFGNTIISRSRPARHEFHLQLSAQPNQLVLAPGQSLCLDISESSPDPGPESGSGNDGPDAGNFDITLDHGGGLISVIRGVTDVTIQPGDEVEQNAMIGRVSERASTRNFSLKWVVSLNGEFINPRLLTLSGEYTQPAENSVNFPWTMPAGEDSAPETLAQDAPPQGEAATQADPAPDTN